MFVFVHLLWNPVSLKEIKQIVTQKPQEILLIILSLAVPHKFVADVSKKIQRFNRTCQPEQRINLNDRELRLGLLRHVKAGKKGKRVSRKELRIPDIVIQDILFVLGDNWKVEEFPLT